MTVPGPESASRRQHRPRIRPGGVASAQAPQVRRPASETVATLPADPFARLRLPGRRSHRLSGRPALYLLASLIVTLLAASAAPTPLYAIYQAHWGFTPITTTIVFGVYAVAVLASLLTLGKLSDHVGRRPVLLAAITVQARRAGVFTTAGGVPDAADRPDRAGPVHRRGARRDRRGHARHRPRARHVRQLGRPGHGHRVRRAAVRAGGRATCPRPPTSSTWP